MKKILFYIPSLEGGGAEKVLITLLKNLSKDRYAVTLVLTTNAGVYLNQVPREVRIKYFFDQKQKLLIRVYYKLLKFIPARFLYRLFVNEFFNVEVAFLEGEAVKILAGSPNKSRKIAWVHTNMANFHWTGKLFRNLKAEQTAFDQFGQIVCVSNDAKNGFSKLFGKSDKLKIIHNLVDKEEIAAKAAVEKINFSNFTVCAVGRLIEVKGYDRLISAHKRLLDDEYIHDLYIVGEGNLRTELEEQVKELNVMDTVKLIGFRENPYPYIKECDLFVISSKVEGFPMVVAEALVLGKAILGTNCMGIAEILENGKYGMIIENSENGLYNGLRNIMENKDLLDKYSYAANERKEKFNKVTEISLIEQLFE